MAYLLILALIWPALLLLTANPAVAVLLAVVALLPLLNALGGATGSALAPAWYAMACALATVLSLQTIPEMRGRVLD